MEMNAENLDFCWNDSNARDFPADYIATAVACKII